MKTNYCIIGTGIAGMSAALHLCQYGKVILVTKKKILSGSTPLAQGGIAAVEKDTPEKDSFQSHIEDTLKAGHYKNNISAVELLVHKAPEVMKDLQEWGIKFSEGLHLEGGHGAKRIFHTGDTTGKTIAKGLQKKIMQSKNITLLDDTYAVDLIVSEEKNLEKKGENIGEGVVLINSDGEKIFLFTDHIILATGGYASVFGSSTSPKGAVGDGIAMAIRAGIETKELSNIQFHPTVLDKDRNPKLLLSEALRGAGAKIVNDQGDEFVDSLLPRDIVAKAMAEEELKGSKIFLDARNIENFEKKFQYLFKTLVKNFSLHPATDLLPITPAAHYCMGGITTDLWGRTSIKNIYASGECAYTGVHGDNRLASNSLLEGLVFSRQIAEYIIDQKKNYNDSAEKILEKKIQEKFFEISEPDDQEKILWIRKNFSQVFGVIRQKEKIKFFLENLKKIEMKGLEGKNFLLLSTKIIQNYFQLNKS